MTLELLNFFNAYCFMTRECGMISGKELFINNFAAGAVIYEQFLICARGQDCVMGTMCRKCRPARVSAGRRAGI